MIRNTVFYTQYSPRLDAAIQQYAVLVRSYKLTVRGAQRILRSQGYKDAIVTNVEAMGVS